MNKCWCWLFRHKYVFLEIKGNYLASGIQFMSVEEAMASKGSPDPFAAQDAFQTAVEFDHE